MRAQAQMQARTHVHVGTQEQAQALAQAEEQRRGEVHEEGEVTARGGGASGPTHLWATVVRGRGNVRSKAVRYATAGPLASGLAERAAEAWGLRPGRVGLWDGEGQAIDMRRSGHELGLRDRQYL